MRATTLAAAAAVLLFGAARARAAIRWHDTYADARKLAAEYGRPMAIVFYTEDKQVKSIKRMFEKPPLARYVRLFVFAYEKAHVNGNQISSALFAKYRPQGMTLLKPLLLFFFAGPDEKVLYKMAGKQTTKNLASAMGLALRRHGPVASLKTLREAEQKLKRADALFEKKDYPAAARLYDQVVALKLKTKLDAAAHEKLAAINDVAMKQFAAALRASSARKFAKAAVELALLKKDYPGLEAGKRAAKELERLRKLPEAKAAFDGLADALAKRGSGSPERPGAPPVAAIKVEVPKPEDDPDAFTEAELDALDVISQGGEGEPEKEPAGGRAEANRLLRLARNWIANRQPAKARELLNKIIRQHPDTLAADQAKILRDSLDR